MSNKNNKNTTTEGSGKPEFSRRKTLKGASAGAFGGVLLTMGREWQNDDRYTAKKVNDATIIRISGTSDNPVSLQELDKAVDIAISRSDSENGAWELRPKGVENIPNTLISQLSRKTDATTEGITGEVVGQMPTNKLVEVCYAVTESGKALQYLGYLQNDGEGIESLRKTAKKFEEDPTIVDSDKKRLKSKQKSNEKTVAGAEDTNNKPDLTEFQSSKESILKPQQNRSSEWNSKVSGLVEVINCPYYQTAYDVVGWHSPFTNNEDAWAIDVACEAWPGYSNIPDCDSNSHCSRTYLMAQGLEINYEDSNMAGMRVHDFGPEFGQNCCNFTVTLGSGIVPDFSWDYETEDANLFGDPGQERTYWQKNFSEWGTGAVHDYRFWWPGGSARSSEPTPCENTEDSGDVKIGDFAGVSKFRHMYGAERCGCRYCVHNSHTPWIAVWWRQRCC